MDAPPKKEVDRFIELIFGVTLIAKVSYKHSFKKNVELDTQLNYLLNKGYIGPSKSPWGAIPKEERRYFETMCRL